MIELQNVNKVFATKSGLVPALEDINLTVKEGDIYGVIGRSGAGKSTLIRCVNLLERPSSGKVFVANQELTALNKADLRKARHQIGMIFQHFNLLATRSVFDNVGLPLELIGTNKADIKKIVLPLLELTGLASLQKNYPRQLSGGQKQRVAIARALSTKPKVLLCDEMTSALDPETTEAILKLIKDINEQMALTMLLITHEMEVIKSIADHVAVIDDGKIIEQSDVVSLFREPQSEIAKTFVESTLKVELPEQILAKLTKAPLPFELGQAVIRIAFIGKTSTQPIIDGMLRSYQVRINILQANIEFLRHEQIGVMIMALFGKREDIIQAETYLQQQGLTIEVIGYVATDDVVIS